MESNTCPTGLGVTVVNGTVYLYVNKPGTENIFNLQLSNNGTEFHAHRETPLISDNKKRVQNTLHARDFRISHVNQKYLLVYKLKHLSSPQLRFAQSTDLVQWKRMGSVASIRDTGMVVPEYTHQGKYVLYYGEGDISVAYSSDLLSWHTQKEPVLSPRHNYFDAHPLSVASIALTQKGITVIYYVRQVRKGMLKYGLGMAIFDSHNPTKLLWRAENPLVDHASDFGESEVTPVGVIELGDNLISYWNKDCDGVVALVHPRSHTSKNDPKKGFGLVLQRLAQNPILRPITHHFWESKQVFNPAAVYEAGKVHLVYRAIGDNDTSMLGYAATQDGYTVSDRSKVPAFVPTDPFAQSVFGSASAGVPAYSPYMSGGGAYGGSEDPRITKIGDRMYLTYIAYDGGAPPRVALTSIAVDDFLQQRWNWERPVLISKPGVVDKNACILPEKIDGKYVIFHRIYPDILVDFVDSLEFDGSRFLQGEYSISPRPNYWDSRKVGIGPTPVKTQDGWLTIYHAVGEQDSGRYKIGAMLLDSGNPTKVIARSRNPILEPDATYENEGFKPGVAYPCGAAVVGDTFFVYYGGADQVVCAAKANLRSFLYDLRFEQNAHLSRVHLSMTG